MAPSGENNKPVPRLVTLPSRPDKAINKPTASLLSPPQRGFLSFAGPHRSMDSAQTLSRSPSLGDSSSSSSTPSLEAFKRAAPPSISSSSSSSSSPSTVRPSRRPASSPTRALVPAEAQRAHASPSSSEAFRPVRVPTAASISFSAASPSTVIPFQRPAVPPSPAQAPTSAPAQAQRTRPRVEPQLQRGHHHSSASNSRSPQFNNNRQRPLHTRIQASQPRPHINMCPRAKDLTELRVEISRLPVYWTTADIWRAIKIYGNPTRIVIHPEKQNGLGKGFVILRPAPKDVGAGLMTELRDGTFHQIELKAVWEQDRPVTSPLNKHRKFNRNIPLKLARLDVGVMRSVDEMLVMHSALPTDGTHPELNLNMQSKCLDIIFGVKSESEVCERYKISVRFAELSKMLEVDAKGHPSLVLPLDLPPVVYRKTDNVEATHDAKSKSWDEKQIYFRQTGIDRDDDDLRSWITQLYKKHTIVDVGRWLTYCCVLDKTALESEPGRNLFREARQALTEFNIRLSRPLTFNLVDGNGKDLWRWMMPNPKPNGDGRTGSSLLNDFEHLDFKMHFGLRYRLEVCLSQGVLHEANVSQDFLKRLMEMDLAKAMEALEKAADGKARIYDPNEIFRLGGTSRLAKSIPTHCATIAAVTITPTTMYFTTPMTEPSNRIVRKYRYLEDHFMRVKFSDEKYKGMIMSADDGTQDEVFARIAHAMTNGIKIGNRHYEFLAFGNSQFREHGAYFFASVPGLTAQKIREDMGDFSGIKVIAKYASRLGQCFSTTRPMIIGVSVQKISDIRRNGFTFTDGVGKISPFLASMIAGEYGWPNHASDFPSVFQFRIAGCKGILAVDPELKGNTIAIRPSQEKFGAPFHGLEICRLSQFSTANLNMQIILVLSSLGVADSVFLKKMTDALRNLADAMTDERKAIDQLNKNIDLNQMSLTLCQMIQDGFMTAKDPFTMACLHLWRSWMIKYLKEKARIFVEKGAFVLGCVDETATLKGHFNKPSSGANDHDFASVPEVFLQIPDPKNKGQFKVYEGICTLARNPSLHPGDIRVVRAIDVPALRHLKNCVVLPQTGDRDLANMCSGGDLDGDDYLVMWDDDLLPPGSEWNHEPMDYTSPQPVLSNGAVAVEDITSFFVSHMKADNLGRIATAHRYWADWQPDGVKDTKCMQLAVLHSKAVDFAKTGVPAEFPKELKVLKWPHWAEKRHTSQNNIYQSRKVLGKLYNAVEKVPFKPSWADPFDRRILEAAAFSVTEEIVSAAKEVKEKFDEDVRRIMAQHGIRNELEVFTAFVLDHNGETKDFKFAESFGEMVSGLKDQYRAICCKQAGTTAQERDWQKLGPFIKAMYKVTSDEMTAAVRECGETKEIGDHDVPVREATCEALPFVSFPWIFSFELGQIARNRFGARSLFSDDRPITSKMTASKPTGNGTSTLKMYGIPDLPEVVLEDDTVIRPGNELNLFGNDERHMPNAERTDEGSVPAVVKAISVESAAIETGLDKSESPCLLDMTPFHREDLSPPAPSSGETSSLSDGSASGYQFSQMGSIAVHEGFRTEPTSAEEEEVSNENVETEQVVLNFGGRMSVTDKLLSRLGGGGA